MNSMCIYPTISSKVLKNQKDLYHLGIREQDVGTVLVDTVEYNKNKYSNCNCLRALNGRKLQNILCRTIYDHFPQIIQTNQLPNYPYTVNNIDATEEIFGCSLQCLKGKTTQMKINSHMRKHHHLTTRNFILL